MAVVRMVTTTRTSGDLHNGHRRVDTISTCLGKCRYGQCPSVTTFGTPERVRQATFLSLPNWVLHIEVPRCATGAMDRIQHGPPPSVPERLRQDLRSLPRRTCAASPTFGHRRSRIRADRSCHSRAGPVQTDSTRAGDRSVPARPGCHERPSATNLKAPRAIRGPTTARRGVKEGVSTPRSRKAKACDVESPACWMATVSANSGR